MRPIGVEALTELQGRPSQIRNICILAHVDHGKTTMADALVASNGIISQRLAGKLRYLDSLEEEQLRGITMKSSAISLHYTSDENKDYLVNLIDSPGHIDFSSEVSTAVRLCDGAVVLVDVVEGVCPQTHAVLRQAWLEKLKPVLVLNKLDRLITELKMSPAEAHVHLQQLLEQINAITGELFTSDFMEKFSGETVGDLSGDPPPSNSIQDELKCSDQVYDWSTGIEEAEDEHLYFSPDLGNVVFASSIDGWGFSIDHFAKLYASKLGLSEAVLLKTLWGDYYLNTKTKRIMKGAQSKAKKPLFVQFILENLWSVYDAMYLYRDKEKTEKILSSLSIKINSRDARHADGRVQLQAMCSQWLPLSKAVLAMVVHHLPSPLQMVPERIETLMCSRSQRFDSLTLETQKLKEDFLACNPSEESPVIVFVSKMVAVDRKMLPQNKQRPLTVEDLAHRREIARERHANLMAAKPTADDGNQAIVPIDSGRDDEHVSGEEDKDHVFVAFARIYSGTLRKGQRVYVLGPKHDPAVALKQVHDGHTIDPSLTVSSLTSVQHITTVVVQDMYLFMGRELEELDHVPAGNVLGIRGLDDHVLKSATLSSTVACPAFTDMYFEASPIVRVAIEPVNAGDISKLILGMRLLNQADSCVQVLVQETGEHVIIAAGEVHLQRCCKDLQERYAKIDINVSSPIVPFRETVVPPRKVDMVNEAIEGENVVLRKRLDNADSKDEGEDGGGVIELGLVEVTTPNGQCRMRIRCVPLPQSVTNLLDKNPQLIKTLDDYASLKIFGRSDLAVGSKMSKDTKSKLQQLKLDLQSAFDGENSDLWEGAVECIWSFGPRRYGPNLLINKIKGYDQTSVWSALEKKSQIVLNSRQFDHCIVSGFQLATLAGPLCAEPMMGVALIMESWDMQVSTFSEETASLKDADLDINSVKIRNLENNDNHASIVTKNGDFENGSIPGLVESLSIKDDSHIHDIPSELSRDRLLSGGSEISEGSNEEVADCKQKQQAYGPMSGQIMSCVKEACWKAFQSQPQRLMVAMYECVVQATADVLGKVYAVLGKRSGRILYEDMREGSQIFVITAALPVVESFGFAEEFRKKTSGLASPQLKFSHWEVVDLDPFWEPSTEEEYMHFGEKADSENQARKYMNVVRRRKGLGVNEKIVEYAEKQRTLSKKK